MACIAGTAGLYARQLGACLNGGVHHFGAAVEHAGDVEPAEVGALLVEHLAHLDQEVYNRSIVSLLACFLCVPENVVLEIAGILSTLQPWHSFRPRSCMAGMQLMSGTQECASLEARHIVAAIP